MAVEEQNAPEATPTAVRGKTGEETYHLELSKCVPENLSGITALTVLGDTIIAGGSSETGPSLVRFQVTGGETQTLDVPDGADYLYALCENPDGGFFLLSGSLPAGYWDERGNFTFLSGEPEGRLVLSRYDASFSLQETTTLEKRYTESGARFFQMTKTDEGLALLSASMLVLLVIAARRRHARRSTQTMAGRLRQCRSGMGYFLLSREICLAAKRQNYARLTQKRSLHSRRRRCH